MFPNQFHYANNHLPPADVRRNIKQDGGVEIDFFDHSPAHRILLKWKDLHAVQIWSEHHRGDLRPQVELKKELANDFQYCDELSAKLDVVRDDTIQTLELALEYERTKSRILRRKLCTANCKSNTEKNLKHLDVNAEAKISIKEELTQNRLTSFAYRVNREYHDALVNHYSGFQANNRLMDENLHSRIYELVEKSFPLHFSVMQSLIFSERAHEAKRSRKRVTEKNKWLW